GGRAANDRYWPSLLTGALLHGPFIATESPPGARAIGAAARRSSSARVSTTIDPAIRIEATAVIVGSISWRTLSHIRFGNVVAAGPPGHTASTTSTTYLRTASAAADRIAGRRIGSVAYQSARA